jgi:hypothetical protein
MNNTTCFLCGITLNSSDKRFGPMNLGKEGIVIPSGMKPNNVICNACYHKEKAQYEKSQMHVGSSVGRVEVHDKVLTPEQIK